MKLLFHLWKQDFINMEERCRDVKVALGVSKFMVKLGFTRENLMCKLSSNYVREGQENIKIENPLQAFH